MSDPLLTFREYFILAELTEWTTMKDIEEKLPEFKTSRIKFTKRGLNQAINTLLKKGIIERFEYKVEVNGHSELSIKGAHSHTYRIKDKWRHLL